MLERPIKAGGMMNDDTQYELPDGKKHCGFCQHSVDVPGVQQIVCLAFLSVRHPEVEEYCSEFEGRRHYSALTGQPR